MEALKIYVSEDTAVRFRREALKEYGYRKGALSKAAENALRMWIDARDSSIEDITKG